MALSKNSKHQLSLFSSIAFLTICWIGYSFYVFNEFQTGKPLLQVISFPGILSATLFGALLAFLLLFITKKEHLNSKPSNNRLSALTGLSFSLLLLSTTQIAHIEQEMEVNERRALTLSTASQFADKLIIGIDKTRGAIDTLSFLIKKDISTVDQFDAIALDLLSIYPLIDNLQLAPKGIVQHIHPLEGNEPAIGHNLLLDPKRKNEALQTIQANDIKLAGPFELIQGGNGVVLRRSVFLDPTNSSHSFWGFINALIKVDTLLAQAGFSSLSDNYHWRLSRIDPDTESYNSFAASVSDLDISLIKHPIILPSAEWYLEIAPLNGWISLNSLLAEAFLIFSVSILLTLLIYNALRYPTFLTAEIDRKSRKLVEKNSVLEQAFYISSSGSWDYDYSSGKLQWSVQLKRMMGWNNNHPPSQSIIIDQIHPEDRAKALKAWGLLTTHKKYDIELRIKRYLSEDYIWFRDRALYDENIHKVIGITQDINESMLRELRLKALMKATEFSPAATVLTTTEPKILYVNRSFTALSGYQPEEVIGKNPRVLQSGLTTEETYKTIWNTITAGLTWSGEIKNKRKDGTIALESISIVPITDDDGEITNYVAVKEDITEKREMETTIWKQANFDLLTNLPNRTYFAELASQAIIRADRHKRSLYILFIDLNHFKSINDQYGHKVGDEVLKEFAIRLKSGIRKTDCAARIGGDEFVTLIEDWRPGFLISELIDKIQNSLSHKPMEIASNHNNKEYILINVTASIGVASYPEDGADLDQLISFADSSMYKQKIAHKNAI